MRPELLTYILNDLMNDRFDSRKGTLRTPGSSRLRKPRPLRWR
jgi:hypothetical protein